MSKLQTYRATTWKLEYSEILFPKIELSFYPKGKSECRAKRLVADALQEQIHQDRSNADSRIRGAIK